MTTTVEIDPNVRVRGNETYAGLEDVKGPLSINLSVFVYESESGLGGTGRVTEIDVARGLVYLAVDWSSLLLPPEESVDRAVADDASFWRSYIKLTLGSVGVATVHGFHASVRGVTPPYHLSLQTRATSGAGFASDDERVLIKS